MCTGSVRILCCNFRGFFRTVIWHQKCHMNMVWFSRVMVLLLLECLKSRSRQSSTYVKLLTLMFIMASLGHNTHTGTSVDHAYSVRDLIRIVLHTGCSIHHVTEHWNLMFLLFARTPAVSCSSHRWKSRGGSLDSCTTTAVSHNGSSIEGSFRSMAEMGRCHVMLYVQRESCSKKYVCAAEIVDMCHVRQPSKMNLPADFKEQHITHLHSRTLNWLPLYHGH